jgi:hypothetical protein
MAAEWRPGQCCRGWEARFLSNLAHSLGIGEEGGSFIFYSGYNDHSDSMETTTIQVDTRIRDLLRSFGRKGETYNEIIQNLIKRARYVEYMEECYNILDSKENWVSLDEL